MSSGLAGRRTRSFMPGFGGRCLRPLGVRDRPTGAPCHSPGVLQEPPTVSAASALERIGKTEANRRRPIAAIPDFAALAPRCQLGTIRPGRAAPSPRARRRLRPAPWKPLPRPSAGTRPVPIAAPTAATIRSRVGGLLSRRRKPGRDHQRIVRDRSRQTSSSGRPSVKVPVLSNTTRSVSARRSSPVGRWLTMMPWRNRRLAAAICTAGTARAASAQGQVMMSTAMAVGQSRGPTMPPEQQPAEEGRQSQEPCTAGA